MPTKHRRIAVTVDPELEEALKRASNEFPDLSSSSLMRTLAVRGAREIPVNPSDERMARLTARTGARPARGNIQEYLKARGPFGRTDPDDPNRGSRILDEMREDKI